MRGHTVCEIASNGHGITGLSILNILSMPEERESVKYYYITRWWGLLSRLLPIHHPKTTEAVGSFGVMGAFMQLLDRTEVIVNTHDYHLNPQEVPGVPRTQ